MGRVKVKLKFNLLTVTILRYLEAIIDTHPVGATFHVEVEPTSGCPFSLWELHDQIRSSLGPKNKDVFFDVEESGEYYYTDENSNMSRANSASIRDDYLVGGVVPLNEDVPPEVLVWLDGWYRKRDKLISYYRRVLTSS